MDQRYLYMGLLQYHQQLQLYELPPSSKGSISTVLALSHAPQSWTFVAATNTPVIRPANTSQG